MHNIFQQEIWSKFLTFHVNLDYLQNVFNYAEKYRHNRHSELMDAISQSTFDQFISLYGRATYEEFKNIDLFYRPMLLQSVFISAYSAFELQLRSIAEEFQVSNPNWLKIDGMKPSKTSYIDKSRTYLQSVCDVKSAAQNAQWDQINKFRDVRNCLVHNGGRLAGRKYKKLYAFLTQYSIAPNIASAPLIIRNIDFLRDFCAIIKVYIHEIIKDIAPLPSVPPLKAI